MADSLTSSVVSKQDSNLGKFERYVREKRRRGLKGNKNKRRGTNFEHRVAAYYRTRGFVVLRSRGSLGPADLIALKEGERDIYIQCKDIKSNRYSRVEMSDFVRFCKRFHKRCVWAYNYHRIERKNGKMKFINLETTPISIITQEYLAR